MTLVEFTQRYLTDIDSIPTEHRAMFVRLNEIRLKAFNKPNTIFRWFAGQYYVFYNNELVCIDHQHGDIKSVNYWIAYEDSANRRWYSDPRSTKAELIASLGINS